MRSFLCSDPSLESMWRFGQFSFHHTSTMPLGNNVRVSRRPMPRQLEMSDWNIDSSSATRDSDRSTSGIFSDTTTMREQPNRRGSFGGNENVPRQPSMRESSQGSYESRTSRSSAFDMNSFSSEWSTIRSDGFDSTFTSSKDLKRGGSSIPTYWSDQGSRHDNQRDVDEFSNGDRIGSATRKQQGRLWNSGRSNIDSLRRPSEYLTLTGSGTGDSFKSGASFGDGQTNSHIDSSKLGGKANSIREAESPRVPATVKTFQNEDGEPARNIQKRQTPSSRSIASNQDEHRSPTHSEVSTPPASPNSARDSVAYRCQNHYPSPSMPSPVSSERSSTRNICLSPCSSISTTRTSSSRVKCSDARERVAQSVMSDLREELYSFRKEMREVFIRVEDMVDVHRSLFKSDPSTGSPILNEALQYEAENLASEAFEQLADLRKRFSRLAKDFQQTEQPTDTWPVPNRSQKSRGAVAEESTTHEAQLLSPIHCSDHGTTSVKDILEDDCSDHQSVVSDNTDRSTREHSPSIRTSSHRGSDDDVVPTSTRQESVGSTSPSNSSCQLQSRWRKNSSTQSIANSDISTRTHGRFSSIVSDSSSLPNQHSKTSEPDTDIFKDFDKRMEEIRCSLNAIASGTSSKSAVPPKKFTAGGACSPIRAMMDATRTRSTLREASRISSHEDDGRPQPSARETELRQLLQELNNISADNGEDV